MPPPTFFENAAPLRIPRSGDRHRAWYLAAAVILFALVFGNWDMVTLRALPVWDAVDYFGPEFNLAVDHIKAGRFLLWNPWVGGGNPDFAEPELGTTSPLLLLVGALAPTPTIGFVAYWLLAWFAGGIGMLLLAKSLRAPAWGAAIVSLAYISSGFYTGHAEHTCYIYSSAFLPFILWRYNAALDKHRYWFAVQAGVLYGLCALGGYPAFTILTPMLLGLWTIGRLLLAKPTDGLTRALNKRVLAAAVMLFLTVSIGGLILCPGYLAIFKSTHGFSDRVGPRPRVESLGSNILSAGALKTFASPYLPLLNLPPNPIWPRSDIAVTSIYICPALIVFALFAWRRWSPARWLVGLIIVFCICCCVGDQLPVRGWLYDYVPPTRYFRNAALFRGYVFLLLGAIAALGMRDLASSILRTRDRVIFLAASLFVVLAAVASFFSVVTSTAKAFWGFTLPHVTFYSFAVAQLASIGIAIVLLAALFQFKMLSPSVLGRCLLAVAFLDAVATLHISKSTMYSEGAVPWWHTVDTGHIEAVNLGEAGLNREFESSPVVGTYPNNRKVALRVPTFHSFITLANRFQERLTDDPTVAALALGPDRFWFTTSPAWLPPTDSSYELFAQKIHAANRPVLILHSEAEMLSMRPRDVALDVPAPPGGLADGALCVSAKIANVSYGPNLLAFSYHATAPGWLLVTDRWAPDWRVTVNGLSQKIMGADFIFRAIQVNPGDNVIRFRFHPTYFIAALIISWSVLALFLISQLAGLPFTRR